jgi:uncharacterized protein
VRSPKPRSVVVDASPLIFLASADLLDLLHRSEWDVSVPSAVRAEILKGGAAYVTVLALATANWIRAADAVTVPKSVLDEDLGSGESEVPALGLSHGDSLVVIDDMRGRLAAGQLGLRVVGTLGLVLAAKSSGRVASARAVLDRLRRGCMYLSDRVVDRALREVGE